MLELPITIRTARIDEVPLEYISRIEQAKMARIVEGYTFYTNEDATLTYTFYAEINIDNSRLWSLFTTFLLSYKTPVSFLFNYCDESPEYGLYVDKHQIINVISDYSYELSIDPFLEFGLIFHHNGKTKEVYVNKAKYLQYWGFDFEEFQQIMEQFSIYRIENLNFIDEYPMIRESLITHNATAVPTDSIINTLRTHFTENKV